MNAMSNSILEGTANTSFSMSAHVLRQWSAPEVILAVTNLADEEVVLFHCIQQARRSTAKVLLVHVLQPEEAPARARVASPSGEIRPPAESPFTSLNRMARQLRWAGIPCEPLLLRGSPLKEIPLVARARDADRILMTAACEKRARNSAPTTLVEELLPGISVPICTVGKCLPPAPAGSQRPAIFTLALSLASDAAMPLAFASRLAQDHHAHLTVMHVFSGREKGRNQMEQTPLALAAQLPAELLREAELVCPLEIAVRKGDPATEILKSASCTNQDFIILGPVGQPQTVPAAASGVVHRVIGEALCPVLVLGPSLGHSVMG